MTDDYPSFSDSSLLGANVYYRGTVALRAYWNDPSGTRLQGGTPNGRTCLACRLTRQVTDLPPACPAHVYEGGLRKVGMPGMSGD